MTSDRIRSGRIGAGACSASCPSRTAAMSYAGTQQARRRSRACRRCRRPAGCAAAPGPGSGLDAPRAEQDAGGFQHLGGVRFRLPGPPHPGPLAASAGLPPRTPRRRRFPAPCAPEVPDTRSAADGHARTAADRKVVPAPIRLSTPIVPPCRRTSSLTSARPMPVPSRVRPRWPSIRWKRSKICGSSASGMPIPVSLTVSTAACPPGVAVRLTAISPARVYLKAFDTRLRTIRSHIS